VVIGAGDRFFVKFNCTRHGILKVKGKRQTVVLENLDLSDRMSVSSIAFSLPMLNILSTPLAPLHSILRSRAALELENLALRHQIGVLRRSARRRAKLTQLNGLFWAWLSRIWSDWRSALTTVQPESVRAWHRRGFDLFWAWKIRRGQPGRPTLADEVRELICPDVPRKSRLGRTTHPR
jgi:hypothetical protein